jgi:hypothetical protein
VDASTPTNGAPVDTPQAPGEAAAPTLPPTLIPNAGIEIVQRDDIALIQASGSDWARRNALFWSVVEPGQGARDWGAVAWLEAELAEASAQGLEMILIVRSAPYWAQKIKGYPCGAISAESFPAFAAFMADVVRRYGAPPFNIRYFEIWNEPDVAPQLVAPDFPFGCWGDQKDADYYGGAHYGAMLKAIYPAVKAVDPEAQVLIGGLLLGCDPTNPPESPEGSGKLADCTPALFINGILESGAGDSFDGVSFHAYDYYYAELGNFANPNWHSSWNTTGPTLVAKTDYLRNLLAAYGLADKYLLNSESALLCGRDGYEAVCQKDDFQLTKAYYLIQSYTLARVKGLVANIWYNLPGWRASALLNPAGEPLPAYQALQFNTQKLDDTAYLGELSGYPGVRGYLFGQGGDQVWVVWSLDGSQGSITLPAAPDAVYDAFGEKLTASAQIPITLAPIYIEWKMTP